LVGNELHANGRHLVVITGANQGGKSTFLRGVGLAQLMMQCGMFVPAHQFTGSVRSGVFTHFKREEDATLTSGKLDEELRRMSDLVDELAAGGLVLMNESFASTNESEGAQIGTAVIRALLDADVTVVCVTHSYELASGLERHTAEDVVFLRAERRDDGSRTYLLIEAGPLPTSFGEDIYRQVFPDASTGSTSAAGCSVADGHLREVMLVEQQRTDT
jgi:DNA mismatch repair ATPase MutS